MCGGKVAYVCRAATNNREPRFTVPVISLHLFPCAPRYDCTTQSVPAQHPGQEAIYGTVSSAIESVQYNTVLEECTTEVPHHQRSGQSIERQGNCFCQ